MMRRKTPCVLGCCGPRLSVIRLSSSTTPISPGSSKMVSPSSGPRAGPSPGISVSTITVPSAFFPNRAECSVRLVSELLYGDVLVVCLVVAAHRAPTDYRAAARTRPGLILSMLMRQSGFSLGCADVFVWVVGEVLDDELFAVLWVAAANG